MSIETRLEELNIETMWYQTPRVKVWQFSVESMVVNASSVKIEQLSAETMQTTKKPVILKQLSAEVSKRTKLPVKITQLSVEMMVAYAKPGTAPALTFGVPGVLSIDVIIPAYGTHTTSYDLYSSPDGGGFATGYTLLQTDVLPGHTVTHNTGAQGTFWYYLLSHNTYYARPNSPVSSLTLQVPIPPPGFDAMGFPSRSNITWRNQLGATVDVFRSHSADGSNPHRIANDVTVTLLYDWDVEIYQTYYYYATATNVLGTSPPTPIKSAIPIAPGGIREVPRGWYGVFPPDDFIQPTVTTAPEPYWQITLRGTIIASKANPNGWNVVHSGIDFVVHAPQGAELSTEYEVFYDDGTTDE